MTEEQIISLMRWAFVKGYKTAMENIKDLQEPTLNDMVYFGMIAKQRLSDLPKNKANDEDPM